MSDQVDQLTFNDAEHDHNNKKEDAPLLICRLTVKYPKTAFFLGFSIHLTFVLITAILFLLDQDVLNPVFNRMPMMIQTNKYYECYQSYKTVWTPINNKFLNNNYGKAEPNISVLELFFYSPDASENILTESHLMTIQKMEQKIKDSKNYSTYCIASGACLNSITNYFRPNYKFNDITNILYGIYSIKKYQENVKKLLHKDAILTNQTVESSLVYSYFIFNDSDYVKDTIEPVVKEFRASYSENKMKIYYFNVGIYTDNLFSQVIKDMMLALGSMLFIYFFMWLQTGSFFITSFGILSIFTGFVGTNLIYRYIFDYSYFGIFHVLSIFIILGIGADDFFIFTDIWKTKLQQPYSSMEHRLSAAYRSAAVAMFTTSLTTATAFICTSISPLLPIATFGLFSALLVTVNYVSVILYFPSILIMHHIYFEKKSLCCCCCRNNNNNETTITTDTTNETKTSENMIIHFLKYKYSKFVGNRFTKIIIIILNILLAALCIYSVTNVDINPEFDEFMKPDTMYGQINIIRNRYMYGSDKAQPLEFVVFWGLGKTSFDGCHKSDYECEGSHLKDKYFDPNPIYVQQDLLKFCNRLENMPKYELDQLKIKINPDTKRPEIHCFIKEMDQFYRTKFVGYSNMTLPWTRDSTETLQDHLPVPLRITNLNRTFYQNFEVEAMYWLSSGFDPFDLDSFMRMKTYEKLLSFHGIDLSNYQLKLAGVSINTTVMANRIGFHEGIPLIEKWEKWVDYEVNKLSGPVSTAALCNLNNLPLTIKGNTAHWIYIQHSLFYGAVYGIIIGICVAFPIILIMTRNIITSICVILSISQTVLNIVALIPVIGWQLGIMEAINLTLVVGLSVDYVVHLAEAYMKCKLTGATRDVRIQYMLEEVGFPVLSGAASTLGSSAFMFGAQIFFFLQFGTFVFCTIGFSLLHSFLLFPALMGTIGPNSDGYNLEDLKRIANWIRKRVNKKVSQSSTCETNQNNGTNIK